MADLLLHHVSVVSKDVPRATAFYKELFGLASLERPAFPFAGAWLAAGPSLQVHIIDYAAGHFRENAVDIMDGHFAFRTDDFDGFVQHAKSMGFREDAAEGDPMQIVVRRNTVVGFNQAYLVDPDRNQIEVNAAK